MPGRNPVPLAERTDRDLWISIAWFSGIDAIVLVCLPPLLLPWRASLGAFMLLGVIVFFLSIGVAVIWGFTAELRRRKKITKQ